MQVVSEFQFGVDHGQASSRLGGQRSSGHSPIALLDSGATTAVPQRPFPEVTICVPDATAIFPNILLDGGGTLIDAGNGYRATELIDHHFPGYRLQRLEGRLALDRPAQTVEVSECVYMVAAQNYSAFLLGELPRLEAYASAMADGVPIVLHGGLRPFHQGLFELAGIDPQAIICVPSDTSVRASRLVHATPTYLHNTTSSFALEFLRRTFSPELGSGAGGGRVYVSRSRLGDAADRRIVNEDELETVLAARGFEIVHPQDVTPRRQLEIFANASTIISPFGAAWANAVVRPAGRSLILATKMTPDFAQIFQYFDAPLSILRMKGEAAAKGATYSQSRVFTLSARDFELISAFVDQP